MNVFVVSSVPPLQPEDFPEMEILWLLTRAWNTGILLYSLAQYPEAERWCGLGMSFLRHLGSLQESYQTQVLLTDCGRVGAAMERDRAESSSQMRGLGLVLN